MVTSEAKSVDLYPLVVDLDGTLTPTDTLIESLVRLVKLDPACIFFIPRLLLAGRAELKEYVASRVNFSAASLPYRQELLVFLAQQRRAGRRIVLATAAHVSIAEKVAEHLAIFDDVIATNAHLNLKGQTKLEAIQARFGNDFVYAGDSAADLPVWQAAAAAILVDVEPNVASKVRSRTPIEREFVTDSARLRTWFKALRIHQWIKNLLVFVPLLTSFGFADPGKVLGSFFAFLAFGLAASATYIVNDLWDIENDRSHPRKRHRPFAAAKISIPAGALAAISLLTLAMCIAMNISLGFGLSLVTYVIVTSAYSWKLKSYVLIDVLTLSLLYTLRILAGSVAIGVSTSSWLLSFSVFLFFSLAIVKRCAELFSVANEGRTRTTGRDYRVGDLTVLWPMGVGASLSSVVIFGLYINTPDSQAFYASPQLLWLVGVGLIYWVARLWIKTSRGEMHDDPIVFAVRDFGSQVTVFCMLALTLAARFVDLA